MAPQLTQSVQRTVTDTVDALNEAGRSVKGRAHSFREIAADVPYALIGGIDLAAEAVLSAVRSAPDVARDRFDELRDRGQRVVAVVRRRRKRGTATAASRGKVVTARRSADLSTATPYEERTFDDLYQLASERDIEGRSNMSKDELIGALRAKR